MRKRSVSFTGLMPVLMAVALVGPVACRPAPPATGGGGAESMKPNLASDLAVIRSHRVLFTHHSVGVNILAGIDRLDAEAGGTRLRTVWLEEAGGLEGPALLHGGGGRNKEPLTKIAHFAEVIRGSPGLKPDLAFMKLCFVDFEPSTDVETLFSMYRRTIEELRRERPEVRFAHVTAPLFARPTDAKSRVRRLLGKQVWEDAANMKRADFNRRLLEAFPGDPVFDLARVEATGPDGRESTFEHEGEVLRSLHPSYTDDGGHLNVAGQRAVGIAAVRFLAGALRKASAAR